MSTLTTSLKDHNSQYAMPGTQKLTTSNALPSPGVNPLEGSPKCSCGKLGLGRHSQLPILERGRGSIWEPRD